MRHAVDDAERTEAHSRLCEARDLMERALDILDGTSVATESDCHLDEAINNITNAIAGVEASEPIFIAPRTCPPVSADIFGIRSIAGA